MESIEAIKFSDYEKISDEIMMLVKDFNVRFNVTLARKGLDGTRNIFHTEFSYESKYLDHPVARSIRRSYGYYLSIDIKNDFDNSILIYPKHMIFFQARLKDACKWFSTLYKSSKGKLVLSHDFTPIRINLFPNKFIELKPIIITYENGQQSEGIQLNSNDAAYAEIPIDKFFEFMYFVNNLNMHQLASTIIASLPIELGTNQMIMGADGRSRAVSFFDKPQKE